MRDSAGKADRGLEQCEATAFEETTWHLETERTEFARRNQSSVVAAAVGTVAEADCAATEAAVASHCTAAVAAEGTAAPEC